MKQYVLTDIPVNFLDLSDEKELPSLDMQAQFWMQVDLSFSFFADFESGQISSDDKCILNDLLKTGHIREAVQRYIQARELHVSVDEFLIEHYQGYFRHARENLMITQAEMYGLLEKCKNGTVFEAIKEYFLLIQESADERFKKIQKEFDE